MENAQETLNELKEDINARIKALDDMLGNQNITATELFQISAVKGELESFVESYPELRD